MNIHPKIELFTILKIITMSIRKLLYSSILVIVYKLLYVYAYGCWYKLYRLLHQFSFIHDNLTRINLTSVQCSSQNQTK